MCVLFVHVLCVCERGGNHGGRGHGVHMGTRVKGN